MNPGFLKAQLRRLANTTSQLVWSLVHGRPRLWYVAGWQGHQNLGDEVVYEAHQTLFARCAMYGVPRPACLSLLDSLYCPFDGALLAGGTMIGRSPVYLRMARHCFGKVKFPFVFGSGVVDPDFWRAHDQSIDWHALLAEWKPVLERCHYIGVRGPMSAERLFRLGLTDVEIIGDPVLSLADVGPSGPHEPKSVGLNLGFRGPIWGNRESVYEQFLELARLAKGAGWKVKWFVVIPGDLARTKELAERSGTGEFIFESYDDGGAFLKAVRSLAVFVGTKLHAVALATCAFVPSIMIEYRPKCRDYMESIGQGDLSIRTDRFSANCVWERMVELESHRDTYEKRLRRQVIELRRRQQERASVITERIQQVR